jgi:hypothetical protein
VGIKSYHIVLTMVVGLTIFGKDGFGQATPKFNRCFYNPGRSVFSKINYDSVYFTAKTKEYFPTVNGQSRATQSKIAPIEPQGSMTTWGWVCRAEYKMQQATKIPLYFRLGSKQYADRLEGK